MNQSDEHMIRPAPAQNGPIRGPMGPRAEAQPGAARGPLSAAGAAVFGALENGVRTAYAVIDEYMRRGQEAARDIFNDPNRRGFMSDDRSNFPGGFNQWNNPMAMLTEQWMAAMRAWGQAWSTMVPGGWPTAGMNPYAPNGMPGPTVTVKVSSASPVEVTANLHPAPDAATLVAEPLRAEGFAAPQIDAPEIAREGGSVRVSVKVGAKQPPGRYRSIIRRRADESVAGELTVVVG